MTRLREALLCTLAGTLLALAALPAVTSAAQSSPRASNRTLLRSHALWATIDVCSPKDQPNTVGIRGSMPGDGKAGDKMYMSFRLQIMSATNRWIDLAAATTPGYVAVGSSLAAREGGRSFQLVPVAGKPAAQLRGVVDYQWRHGKTVLLSISRPTTAEHQALAGADPAGFSAASCSIG